MLKTINCFGRSFLFANSVVLVTASNSLAQFIPPPPPMVETREQNQEVYQFEAPRNSPSPLPKPRQSSPSNANTLFRVQVYGNSEQLLSLVRRVEPDAFVRDGKDAIQAGLFSDAVNAIQLVQSLSEQGIEADIIKIRKPQDQSSRSNSSPREYISLSSTSSPEPPEPSNSDFVPIAVESASPTPETPVEEEDERGYYVVIPTREEKLAATAQKVKKAGVNQNLIEKRNAPRGNHVAVGPFPRRGEANRWSSHLENEGLNARVYFSR
ncbi:UNVERIFIED_CONTAM: hypothetical protein BEN50_18435 [Euhalothece sp. KZN 001]